MHKDKLSKLRKTITENLRVQKGGDQIKYIDVGSTIIDASSKQNHVIFARRGCGKTLLLHASGRDAGDGIAVVYLNCEEFKKHSYPNVLVEILSAIFIELSNNLHGWFGKKKRSKDLIHGIITRLSELQRSEDVGDRKMKSTNRSSAESATQASATISRTLSSFIPSFNLLKSKKKNDSQEVEAAYDVYIDKTKELDLWLPALKRDLKDFFANSTNTKHLFLQIDDLYHLKRADQAFVMDYIHRLCKDVPIFLRPRLCATHPHCLSTGKDSQSAPRKGMIFNRLILTIPLLISRKHKSKIGRFLSSLQMRLV